MQHLATDRLPADRWCSVPSWRRVARPPLPLEPPEWPVVVLDTDGHIAAGLRDAWGDAARLIEVRPASSYAQSDRGIYEIDPWNDKHYERLMEEIGAPSVLTLIHSWAGACGWSCPRGSARPR